MPIAIAKRISRNQSILSTILIEPPHQIPPIIPDNTFAKIYDLVGLLS
jgi:hypothetical protein